VSAHTSPPRIAIVGHTNSGKTSLLRTLLRDASFGEVSPRAGTTRAVAAAELRAAGETIALVHDSPGLEDPRSLAAAIAAVLPVSACSGPERLQAFLASPAASAALSSEAQVMALALASDLLLCVLDAREPPQGRLIEELRLLQLANRPIVPVLNFTADAEARPEQWRAALAELQLHASVDFDTVLFDAAGERRLYRKLQALLDAHADAFERLLAARADERTLLRDAALMRIARLLARASAIGLVVESADARGRRDAVTRLQAALAALEAQSARGMVEDFRHRAEGLECNPLELPDAPWSLDLYAPGVLERLGAETGRGVAAGAAIGVGVDLLVSGLTLGVASGLGAGAGAAAVALWFHGQRWWQWLRGRVTLVVERSTVAVVGLRQVALLHALEHRGHASLAPIRLAADLATTRPKAIDRLIERGRCLPPRDPNETLGEAEIPAEELAAWMEALRAWLPTAQPTSTGMPVGVAQ